MRSKSVLIAISDRNIRLRMVKEFLSRGFNIIAEDMREPVESYFVRSIQVDIAVMGDPAQMPGGDNLLEILNDLQPTIQLMVVFTDRAKLSDYLTKGNDPLTAMFVEDDWDKILKGLISQNLNDSKALERRHERKDTHLVATCEVSPNRPVISCLLKNISSSGAFVSANGFFPKVGEVVELHINLEDSREKQIVVAGVVRWVADEAESKSTGFGLEFGFFNLHERDAMSSLMAA